MLTPRKKNPENVSKRQRFWIGEIEAAMKREERWRKNGKRIVKRYRDDENRRIRKDFNILWANTQILKAATFSKLPPANLTRRYKTDDALIRDVSEMLERAIDFYADESEFTNNIRKARDDMLLPGRGTVWIQYNAAFEKTELEPIEMLLNGDDVEQFGSEPEVEVQFALRGEITEPDGFFDGDDDQQRAFVEQLTTEDVSLEFVYWQNFLNSGSRSWEDVWWVAREHGMDRQQLINMFGTDVVLKIDSEQTDQKDSEGNKTTVFPVFEIWDKDNNERVWMTRGANDTLDVEDPPLDLPGFFPCPKPLYSFETTDTMVPESEYIIYEDQANQLDDLEDRLGRLTKSLRAAGVYNAKNGKMLDFSGYEDGQLVPVNYAEFGIDGSLKDQIQYLPIADISAVIDKLEGRKLVLINEIHQLTGITDIQRGATDPNETATAQSLKGSYGNIRLRPRREPVEEMIRDIYRIMTEVIASKFSIETLRAITGMEVTEQHMEFMQNDELRNFRINVESDSTVEPNQELDKRNTVEFLQAMGGFFAQTLPAAEANPALAPMLGEMLKFAASSFKTGRPLGDIIDKTIDDLSKSAQQQGQEEQQPTPAEQIEMQKMQIEQGNQQIEQAKLQIAQGDQQIDQARLQLESKKIDADLAMKQADLTMTNQNNETDLIQDQQNNQVQLQSRLIDHTISTQDNESDERIAALNAVKK